MSHLYHHCKLFPIYIVYISSIGSLYICYVASTHKFVKKMCTFIGEYIEIEVCSKEGDEHQAVYGMHTPAIMNTRLYMVCTHPHDNEHQAVYIYIYAHTHYNEHQAVYGMHPPPPPRYNDLWAMVIQIEASYLCITYILQDKSHDAISEYICSFNSIQFSICSFKVVNPALKPLKTHPTALKPPGEYGTG